MQVPNTSQTTTKPEVNFTAPSASQETPQGIRARLSTSHISWHEPTTSGPPLPPQDGEGKLDNLFKHFSGIKRAEKVTTLAPSPSSTVSREIICDADKSAAALKTHFEDQVMQEERSQTGQTSTDEVRHIGTRAISTSIVEENCPAHTISARDTLYKTFVQECETTPAPVASDITTLPAVNPRFLAGFKGARSAPLEHFSITSRIPIDFSKYGLYSSPNDNQRPIQPDFSDQRSNTLKLSPPRSVIADSTAKANPAMTGKSINEMKATSTAGNDNPVSEYIDHLIGIHVLMNKAADDLARSKAEVASLIKKMSNPVHGENNKKTEPSLRSVDLGNDEYVFYAEPKGLSEPISPINDENLSVLASLEDPTDQAPDNTPELEADARLEVVPPSLAKSQEDLAFAITSIFAKIGDASSERFENN
ncbi:hypothetical protein ACVBEF_16175 [Glaciimonas sp. GG7]